MYRSSNRRPASFNNFRYYSSNVIRRWCSSCLLILDTIDPVTMAATVFDDFPDVAKQVTEAVAFENGNSIFRRKHDLIGDGGERRHRTIVPRSTPAVLAPVFTLCP
jgi:hypothetical protein